MSITISTNPDTIQPVYNQLVYQFSSTAQTAYYKFRYVVDVYVDDVKEARLKITPQFSGYARTDVSNIVENYLTSRPINKGCTGTTETPIVKAEWGALEDDIHKVYIRVGEEYSTTPEGDVLLFEPIELSNVSYFYNGVKNWYEGKQFNMSDYYLSNYSLPTEFPANDHKYLTFAPRSQYIGDSEWYTLTGLNVRDVTLLTGTTYDTYSQPVYSALFEFFDSSDSLISSGRTYNIEDNCGQYIDCTNVTGSTTNGDNHWFEYVGAGTKNLEQHGITLPTNWDYYRVSLEGVSGLCTTYSLTCDPLSESQCQWSYTTCDGSGTTQTVNAGFSALVCASDRPVQTQGTGSLQVNADCTEPYTQTDCTTYEVEGDNDPGVFVDFTYEACSGGTVVYSLEGSLVSPQFCARTGTVELGVNQTLVTYSGCSTIGCHPTYRISEYFYFYKDPTCGPGSRRVMWLNSFGTYDYFTFKFRDNVGYDMNREVFQEASDYSRTNWETDKYYGWNNRNRVWNQNISKTGLLYSGRIPKSYLAWMTDELLKSPSVYFIDDDGDMQPIVLTNTEVVEPNFQRNDGEYELILEYSGGYNEVRQNKE